VARTGHRLEHRRVGLPATQEQTTIDRNICSPYRRATFRYTPLLPLLLSPTLLHPLLGKLTLLLSSLLVTPLLLSISPRQSRWPAHILWTLNPLVMNITTRGSPEALVVLPVIAFLALLKRGKIGMAGGVWAVAVGWKLYPIIYGPAVWTFLARRGRGGWLRRDVWTSALSAVGSFTVINGALWSM
jgi:phosphatidylinositol glycan class M